MSKLFCFIICFLSIYSCSNNKFVKIKLDEKGYKFNESKEMLLNFAKRKMLHPFWGNQVHFNNLQFSLVWEDINNNDSIDYGVDKLHLGSIRDSFIYISEMISNSVCIIEESNFIKIDDSYIEIDVLDRTKKKVLIKKSTNNIASAFYSDKIPSIKLLSLSDGTMHDISTQPPKKYTYIYFWGSWCEPCMKEIKKIKEVYEKFNTEVNIIGINCKENNIEKAKLIVKNQDMKWLNLISDSSINKYFHQNGYPFGALYKDNILIKNKCDMNTLIKILNNKS